MRLESVGNAIDMGECAAENMAGGAQDYVPQPWFWSDQFDIKLQIAGLSPGYTASWRAGPARRCRTGTTPATGWWRWTR